MNSERPTEPPGNRAKTGAMIEKAAGVIVADALDAADDDLVTLLDPCEPHPPIERQVLFGRVHDLKQMPFEPGAGKAGERGIDRVERRQKITDQNQLAGARQWLEDGEASGLGPLGDQLDDPRQRNASADWGYAASEQSQPLAAAHQQARQCHEQQFGAIALGRPMAPKIY